MTRPPHFMPASLAVLVVAFTGCASGEIEPGKDDPDRRGAELFYDRCSGCHSLDAANAYGSKPEGEIAGGERTNGPNFNVKEESRDDVLFAIRNGGFSGAIMPANIVVGDDAKAVADFLAKYSGRESGGGDVVGSGEVSP